MPATIYCLIPPRATSKIRVTGLPVGGGFLKALLIGPVVVSVGSPKDFFVIGLATFRLGLLLGAYTAVVLVD